MPGPLSSLRAPNADLFVVSHSGARAGAPMVLLHLLRWLRRSTTVDTSVVLLHGGVMEEDFKEFDARILGGHDSRLWMLQRGLTNLHQDRLANGLAAVRLGPTMWANRNATLTLMNSVASLIALRFLPADSPGKRVLYVHEMEQSFERTIGQSVWDRFSPRVDHFITCADAVTDFLVEAKGVHPDRITCHRGFVEPPCVDPLRSNQLREAFGIPPDAFVIGASGRPDWRKAPEVFVRLARTITSKRPDLNVHFVWLGGPMEGSPGWRLTHDFEAAGLDERFHLTDESNEPTEIMSLFDVFALTSREDSYPLAMVEAGALGVPIVSFDNGGVRELAAAGGTGKPLATIVPYLDVEAMSHAVLRLLDDPAERADMSARIHAYVTSNHLVDQGAPRLFETLTALEPRLKKRVGAPDLAPAG